MLNHPFNVLRRVDQRNAVVRDPISLTTLLFPTLVQGTAAFFLASTAIFIGITAVTSWAVAALTPKPKAGSTGLLTNQRDVAAAGEVVYGRIRKGGPTIFTSATDSENETLRMVIVLAAHEIDAVEQIYLDDRPVTLDSEGWVTNSHWGENGQRIRIVPYLGTQSQTTPPDLIGVSGVTSDFKGTGIAYLYVTMKWDEKVFINGIPLVTAVVRGKKVFDPRNSTTAWSNNWALCVRDYLTNSNYGVGSPTSEVDADSFIAAANASDVAMGLSGGGTEPKYTCNGVLSTAETPKRNLEKLMTAGAGTIYWTQGKWMLKAGAWTTPVKTFDYSDLRSEIQISTRVSVRDNFNVVKGTFISSGNDWITVDYPEYRGTSFLTQDNNVENVLDLELPLTTSRATAQRIAKLTLFRTREQIVVSGEFSLKAFEVCVGDNVRLNLSRYGWNDKTFEVVSWRLLTGSGGDTRVSLVLKETSEAAFSWNAEERQIISNDSTLPDPFTGLTIGGFTRTNINDQEEDGRSITSVELNWNHINQKFRSHYEVQWRRSDAGKWQSTTTTDNSLLLERLKANWPYDFRVRVLTAAGFRGPWTEFFNFITGKDTTPPSVVSSGWSATGEPGQIVLRWDTPNSTDFKHVEIWENTTDNSGTATRIARSTNNVYRRTVPAKATRFYWLKSVDFSGNASAFSEVKSATATRIQKDLIGPNAVTSSAIRVSDPTNLIINGNLLDGDREGWNKGGGSDWNVVVGDAASSTNPIATMPAPYSFQAAGDGLYYESVSTRSVKATENERFRVVFDYAAAGATTNTTIQVVVYFGDRSGAYVDLRSTSQVVNTNTWNTHRAVITAPTGCAQIYRVEIRRLADGSGQTFLTNFALYRMNGQDLVVDGTLQASHIDTNSFSASGLALFNGTLQSTNFSSGSTGWRIQNNGNAEFNKLIVRNSLAVGAISDQWEVNDTNSYLEATTETQSGSSLSISNLPAGNIYLRGFQVEARKNTNNANPIVTIRCQVRRWDENSGAFTPWSTVATFDQTQITGTNWERLSASGTFASHTDTYQMRVTRQSSGNGAGFNVLRNIRMVAIRTTI